MYSRSLTEINVTASLRAVNTLQGPTLLVQSDC